MVKLVVQRRKRQLQVGEVHHPAQLGIGFARYMDFYAERMPMQPRTLVPGRYVGQPVGRLELKYFEDMHGGRLRANDGPAEGHADESNHCTRRPLSGRIR